MKKIIPQILAVTLSFLVVEHGKAMEGEPGEKVEKGRQVSHRKKPLIDFRYWSLEVGLKDPTSLNAVKVKSIYGKDVIEYYDDYYGNPFSKKQPEGLDQINGKKALPFSEKECLSWLKRKDEKVKAYDAALRRAKEAEKKLRTETEAWNAANPHSEAALDELTKDLLTSVESLSDLSGLEDRGRDTPEPDQGDQVVVVEKKVNLDTTLFNQARLACQQAKDDFDRLLKKLLAEHPLRVIEDEHGERVFVLRDRRQLEELIYDQNLKRLLRNPKQLTLLHSTPIDLEDRKKRVRGFAVVDPIDIKIGFRMLEGRNQRLEHLLSVLKDIRTRYFRDYRPNVKHVLSLTELKDWYYETSFSQVQAELVEAWPVPPTRAKYPLSDAATHEQITRRVLRRDKLGELMKEAFLDAIVRYEEPKGDLAVLDSDNDDRYRETKRNFSCEKPFSEIYRGLDEGTETTLGNDEPLVDDTKPKREFLRDSPTKFFNITTRLYKEEEKDPLLIFQPPCKVQMGEMVRSFETMRFHRSHWHTVMNQLHSREGKKKGEEGVKESLTVTAKKYAKECERNRKLTADVTQLLQELQQKPPASLWPSFLPSLLPPPIELIYIRSKPSEILVDEIERKDGIDLSNLQLTDREMNTLWYRPHADRDFVVLRGEPILGQYDCLDLGNNLIQEPFKFPFGFAFQNTLVSLDLSFNRLKSFDFLPTLKALRKFNGSGNKKILSLPIWREEEESLLEDLNLSHINLIEVESLCFLVNLTALDLSHTNIHELRPLVSLVKLVKLDVSNTRVKTLMDLGKLVALEELSASECLMEGTWKEVVPPLPNLTRLELRKNPIKWFPYNTKERARKALSSSENVNNDSEFNEAFPKLVSLGAEDEFLQGEKIKLSDLRTNPMFFGN